jgi:predicted phosphodiesterase
VCKNIESPPSITIVLLAWRSEFMTSLRRWRACKLLLICSLLLPIAGVGAWAQDEPYKVHETLPVILDGPYLVAPSETGITVVWRTDTPCHSKVLFGRTGEDLERIAEPNEHGLLPVGTLHAIRLEELLPGQGYDYKVVSTRVVRLKPYWPEKGLPTVSPIYSFTTPDRNEKQVRFSFMTDTQHENVSRLNTHLNLVQWEDIDFLVHGGDALSWVEDEDQVFEKWLGPISERLTSSKPLIFARGNHDMRGPYARSLYEYVPTPTGSYYYSVDAGPVHLLVLDTGEDKTDDKNVYAGLNRFKSYKEEEFAWLESHVETSQRLADAPFRIIAMHGPFWGWVDDQKDKWTELANKAGIDLVIAGHHHRLSKIPPGERGNDYTVLVVGQDQVATVEATTTTLSIAVVDKEGTQADSFVLTTK